MKRSLHQLIADGVVGGVLAGLVVALWFLAVDSIAGRPFHTPAALASALTRQAVGPPTFRLVAAYSVVHFGVFAVLGVVMAGAIAALRTPPRLLFGVLFGLVAQELAFYAGLLLSDASRVAVVPWPHVVAANVPFPRSNGRNGPINTSARRSAAPAKGELIISTPLTTCRQSKR